MESTHDLDFVFRLPGPQSPRVYAQGAYGFVKDVNGSFDIMWTMVTMDDGTLVATGRRNLLPSYRTTARPDGDHRHRGLVPR